MSGPAPECMKHPPRFLADENLDPAVVRGAHDKRSGMVFLTATEATTRHMLDPDLLRRARELDLILISHDQTTLPQYFAELLMQLHPGEHTPGVFIITQKKYSIGQIIDFILEVYDLSDHEEWRDQINHLPL